MVPALRARARTLRNRLVNQQLKQLQQVRNQLLRGEVDVLALGDSSFTTPSPRDTDFRMIPTLLGEQLDGARVATIASAGLSGALFGEFLRVLSGLDQRPAAVVFSFPIRTNAMTHVWRHPRYSYSTTHAALAAIRPEAPRIRAFGKGHEPFPADFQEFEKITVHTRWGGESTIGRFRTTLQGNGPHPWPPDLERMLFDYYHGEVVEPDNPYLPRLAEFGARITEYGVPAFAYWTIPPLAEGERLFPGEFADHVRGNWDVVRKTLTGATGRLTVVEPELADEDFEDVHNANEHFSLSGRLKIADLLAERVRSL